MRPSEISQFLGGTADPAFAVDGLGDIFAWNSGASAAFGFTAEQAIGRRCNEVICGKDENGLICSSECVVRRSARSRKPLSNFDLRIHTPRGTEWFNCSAIFVDVGNSDDPCTVHIMRFVDLPKRFELLLRDFVLSKSDMSSDQIDAMLASPTAAIRQVALTGRELEILRLVHEGGTSVTIGEKLFISPSTVDNHLRHILRKLNAHSRLEAVLRAERSGLL